MILRNVVYAPEAQADLLGIYDWIAEAASPAVALAYVEKIEAHLRGFDLAGARGTQRDDIRLGLRIVGFRRRLTIAFTVDAEQVVILRLFHGGQDWQGALAEQA